METLPPDVGVILIDHGSTRIEANRMLEEVARSFRAATGAKIVEFAHMELSEPTLADAFAQCVRHGAREIVIHPYFLAPGRHSTTDIPALAAEAAKAFPGVAYRVTEPLGIDPRMNAIILRRIEQALGLHSEDG